MNQELQLVKLGGKLISDPHLLHQFLVQFSQIEGKKVLIHGGARVANEWSQRLGIEPNMFEGRRITDAPTLDVVIMIYAGLLNKKIVSQLQAIDCNAVGLSGADGDLVTAHKRKGGKRDYGFAGDIDLINLDFLDLLLKNDLTPVICPITHNGKGQLLNTNADTIAQSLGTALATKYRVTIKYCFEFDGVLQDLENPKATFSSLNEQRIIELKRTKILSAGMLPKIDNALLAAKSPVSNVFICGINNLVSASNATKICE